MGFPCFSLVSFEHTPTLALSMTSDEQPSLFADDPAPAAAPRNPLSAAPRSLANQPLAARMRPRRLSEVVGQDHLLKAGSLLPRLVAQNRFGSLLSTDRPAAARPV